MPKGYRADGTPSGPPPPSRRNAVERSRRIMPPHQWGMLMETAWRLKLRGLTIVEIANQLGFTTRQVSKALKDYRDANPAPDLDQHRRLEIDRLDLNRQRLERMLTGVMHAEIPDIDLARKLVMDLAKLSESERKLIGLDAAEKKEVDITIKSEEERKLEELFDRIEREANGQ